jgi:phage terminase small subunit
MELTVLEQHLSQLTAKQRQFWVIYSKLGNATEAYRQVYSVANMAEASITREASRLLENPRFSPLKASVAKAVGDELIMDARQVLKEWVDIATADPNELIRHVRWCCRCCHGIDGQHQWRDPEEWAAEAARAIQIKQPPPTNAGGYGFNSTRDPNPDCRQCDGLGRTHVFVADTTKLTGRARKLYAGIKQTKDGIQVMTRDQDAAVANIARHLGMFQDNVNLKGLVAHVDVPLTDEQAAILSKALNHDL